jgi:hypothetical protein
MTLPAYEKLGAFYLGKNYDMARGQLTEEMLLYDSKDLTTHAVCVGMTGSGKTGLCLSLLEEAAIYTPGSSAGLPADQRTEREREQYGESKTSTAISIGTTILGAIFGRKAASVGTATRAGTSLNRARRAQKEKEDIARAQADAQALRDQLAELEEAFEEDAAAIQAEHDPAALELEAAPLRPRKSDIAAEPVRLAWTPWTVDAGGIATAAYGA